MHGGDGVTSHSRKRKTTPDDLARPPAAGAGLAALKAAEQGILRKTDLPGPMALRAGIGGGATSLGEGLLDSHRDQLLNQRRWQDVTDVEAQCP